MKKIRILLVFISVLFIFFLTNNVFASEETTRLLYQDITINKDGSITVKEAAWLNGEYNGRLRDIDFENTYATTFTGIYSNFAGNTDIYNKYNSLRWLAFGDSHTEQQSYQKWVNDKLNFTYISNSGLGGSCIAKGYGNVLSFIDRYKNNVTNTEIVTIYGGSNDYAQNVPLDNETNKLDNTTFKGAIREIIEWYSTNYPSKFLFFISPTQCFYPQFASNGYKNNLGLLPLDYSNAVVEVCKEYSIEVIKLHESIGINIKNQSTLLEDGVHLTDETNKRVAQLIINSFEKIYY